MAYIGLLGVELGEIRTALADAVYQAQKDFLGRCSVAHPASLHLGLRVTDLARSLAFYTALG